ncbi:MAG: DUF3592 domain-containing protein [Clostridia bacterium]|nr:DUF3592 domain-containing protein [Clostridia bacterium]
MKIIIKNKANSVLLIAFVFLLITGVMFLNYYISLQHRKAIADGVIVEATVVKVERDSERSTTWRECYEYVDDNGVKYSGWGKSGIKSEAEARAHIGTKIKIYIDGKGNSIPVGRKPAVKSNLILSVIFATLTIILIVIYICLLAKRKDEKALIEQENAKQEEERKRFVNSSFLADLQQLDSRQEELEEYQKDEHQDFS